ncbi:putative endopeptidase [Pustulibacterium marinum]|uniref:Putative endopeptidase n=1 Tax=Pustulibacterium marinum TaxID=1224947 RepID=A0A1I7EZV9_9FLAO|nr:M13 family metallopeptidase [Pustulibacterium marinum]SFU29473.1 putative endopeptidase [Pustulibacterium marinum]
MKRILKPAALALTSTLILASCEKERKVNETAMKEEHHGLQLQYMDSTANPKDDFFRFVNGKWLDSTEIPADKTAWGSFYELREKTDKDVLEILNKALENKDLDPNSDEAKAVYLYKTIMDIEARNKQGVAPILPVLAKADNIKDIPSLEAYLIEMQTKGGGGFFGAYVDVDAKDSNKHVVSLGAGGLGLPDRDYYVADDEDSKEKKQKYQDHIARMFGFLNMDETEAKEMASKIVALETQMAEIRMDKVDRRDANKTYNPTAISDLQKMTPAINWKQYFKGIGMGSVDTVIVSDVKYFKELNKILEKKNIDAWKAYAKWMSFDHAATTLSEEIETANWEFFSKTLSGAKEQEPREKRALQTINWTVGEALGKLYVKEMFPAEAKATAEEMIANVIKAYEIRIDALPWMDAATKEKAKEKLEKTTIKVGYPDHWKDYSGLTIKSNEDGGTYYSNMQNASTWRYKENLEKLNEPVDKTEWFMAPQTVNAYYNPSYNEIVFPAAILQPPFFDFKADPAVNYGGIGAVIGHEISHGFDDSGADFDADGNLVNWWTDKDLEQFNTLGTKLADQYSAIEVLPEVHINGKFTLGENIGDLGGVNAAYDGLQMQLKKDGNPGKIDGLTQDQRFFMSWATVWRTKMRPDALQTRIKTDPHSPGMYRATQPLLNIDAFYAAFNIKEGDSMYIPKDERVKIW